MDIPNPFKKKLTMEEWQQKNEMADQELSYKKKVALMKELEQKGGKYKWQEMTDNGKKSGINFSKVWNWLKQH